MRTPMPNDAKLTVIVEMRFGSHLFGTATAESDFDYKAVYLPDARDILLQRVRGTVTLSSEKAGRGRNLAAHDLTSLVRGLALPDGLETAVAELLSRKANATEHGTTARVPAFDDLIAAVLQPCLMPKRRA